MIDEIELAMILYTQGHKIKHDVVHFIKVHQYARLIGKAEHLEEREQFEKELFIEEELKEDFEKQYILSKK